MSIYTGIGSRACPDTILNLFTRIASSFNNYNWVLRSGGAQGADSAFEQGCFLNLREIFLPWNGFEGKYEKAGKYNGLGYKVAPQSKEREQMAIEAWEARRPIPWDKLTRGIKAMMLRNVNQILGADLKTPTKLVVCWTKNGDPTQGGTAQALYIAKKFNIPIINFGSGTIQDNIDKIKPFVV